jgi:hypothetical protein
MEGENMDDHFTVAELLTILHHEAYTDREKRLARQCMSLLDQLLRANEKIAASGEGNG